MGNVQSKKLEEADKQAKEIILSEVDKLVHDILYTNREASEVSSIRLFQLLGNKYITTSDLINRFARELRKEVE